MPASQAAETHCPPQPQSARAALTRANREARRLLREKGLLAASWAFRIHPVSAISGSIIDLGGTCLNAPALAELCGSVTSVAAAACTLGPGVEARIASLFATRQRVLAMALDQVASERLFTLADQVHARIARAAGRRGLRAGLPEHPGDPGVALDAQAAVLALAGVEAQAITAISAGMLRPVKSLSFLVALGADLPERGSEPRCARCASQGRCTFRK